MGCQRLSPPEFPFRLPHLGAAVGIDADPVRHEPLGQQQGTLYLLKILERECQTRRILVVREVGLRQRRQLIALQSADAELDPAVRDLPRLEILGQRNREVEQSRRRAGLDTEALD